MQNDGERLDEVFESPPDGTQDWYFDLPQGAWERQEQKNRNLRQTLLNKQAEAPNEPKATPVERPKQEEKKRRWFGGKSQDQGGENEPPQNKPRFQRLSEETREERRARLEAMQHASDVEADDWTTEPAPPLDDPRRPLLRRERSEEEKNAFAEAPEGPVSRWDAMFGSGLQEGSIVEGMRQWARGGDAGEDAPEGEGFQDDAPTHTEEEGWGVEDDGRSMLEILRARRQALSPEQEHGAPEPGRASDAASAAESVPPSDEAMAAAMDVQPSADLEDRIPDEPAANTWTSVQDAPADLPVAFDAIGEAPAGADDADTEDSWEFDPAVAEWPRVTAWDGFESALQRAQEQALDDLEPGVVEPLANIASETVVPDAIADALAVDEASQPEPALPEPRKRGFFGRMFRRGRPEEPAEADPFEELDDTMGEWLPAEAIATEEPLEAAVEAAALPFHEGPTVEPVADETAPVPDAEFDMGEPALGSGNEHGPEEATAGVEMGPAHEAPDQAWASESAANPVAEIHPDLSADFRAMERSGWEPISPSAKRELDTSWMAPAGSTARDAAAWDTVPKEPEPTPEPETRAEAEDDAWSAVPSAGWMTHGEEEIPDQPAGLSDGRVAAEEDEDDGPVWEPAESASLAEWEARPSNWDLANTNDSFAWSSTAESDPENDSAWVPVAEMESPAAAEDVTIDPGAALPEEAMDANEPNDQPRDEASYHGDTQPSQQQESPDAAKVSQPAFEWDPEPPAVPVIAERDHAVDAPIGEVEAAATDADLDRWAPQEYEPEPVSWLWEQPATVEPPVSEPDATRSPGADGADLMAPGADLAQDAQSQDEPVLTGMAASVEQAADDDAMPWASWTATPEEEDAEAEPGVAAAASVEEEADDDETPWAGWAAGSEEEDAEAEPVVTAAASVEEEADDDAETPWAGWAAAADDGDEEAEPVVTAAAAASVEEEADDETAWAGWAASSEQEDAEAEPVVTAAASVEEEADDETPWAGWAASSEQEDAEAEPVVTAAASVEEEADDDAETPWAGWAAAADDGDEEAEPVVTAAAAASVEEEADDETAWAGWAASSEQEDAEAEPVVTAAASVEEEADDDAETPWAGWAASSEQEDAEAEPVVTAAASVEEEADDDAETPWAGWAAAADDEPEELEPALGEVTASASEEFAATAEDDRTASWSAWARTVREVDSADDEQDSEDTAATAPEDDPWAALAEVAIPDQSEEAPADSAVPSSDDEDDETWAAIAAASGYDGDNDEAPPPTYKSPLGAYGPREGRASWLADHFPEQEPAPDPVETAFSTIDDADMERDLVLRAFEAHAASHVEEPEPEPLEPGAFRALFGDEADRIVDEMIEPQPEQSFARMRLSPQKSSERSGDEPEDWVSGDENRRSPVSPSGGEPVAPPFVAAARAQRDNGKQTRTWVRELVETGLLALLVFLSVRASFQNFKVDGSSMYPTLEDGQFLIVNKLVYSEVDVDKLGKVVPFVDGGEDPRRHVFHGPQRGDIVVLRDPSNPQVDLIKRVIGLPGEKVEVLDGAVYINDRRLEEPYIKHPWGASGSYGPVIVSEGSYFVMGDNRDNSKDSRSAQIGFIAEELIIGRAELSYLPLDAFGLIGNGGPSLSEQDGRPTLSADVRPPDEELALAR